MVQPSKPPLSDDDSDSSPDSTDQATKPATENEDPEESVTYITVETQDGQLEQLKVLVDDTNFGTSDPIVKSLVENGELQNKHFRTAHATERRGSLFKRKGATVTPISSGLDLEVQLEHGRTQREGSLITPGLISNLKKNKKRIVAKGGQCNIHLKNVSKKKQQFLRDMFTTAVDMEWRYTLLAFASSFFVSWLVFRRHLLGHCSGKGRL